MQKIQRIHQNIDPRLYYVAIALVGAVVIYLSWYSLQTIRPVGIRLLYDQYDIGVYFKSSRWVIGKGTLYKDVFSEYPLIPNLIFGTIRYLSHLFHPFNSERESFTFIWVIASWFLYLFTAYLAVSRTSIRSLWLWLIPSVLYFSLFKFDIYPAFVTLLALLSIRDEKYRWGAFWLGISIALKGYTLFILPAYFVFIFYRRGLKEAINTSLICLAPFLLGNLVVFAYAGVSGVTAPYQFHAIRNHNGESTYDAISFIVPGQLSVPSRITNLLQAATALLAAGLRPKTFDRLVDAFIVAIVGFITFSIFYSPQYCLWVVPIVCFSTSQKIRSLTIIFSWITFIYFPIGFDLNLQKWYGSLVKLVFFKTPIVLITALRFLIMYFSIRRLLAALTTTKSASISSKASL